MTLVADTSGLVSLASVEPPHRTIVGRFFDGYDVVLPSRVVRELEGLSEADDRPWQAAQRILADDGYRVRDVSLDAGFPLDDGENAAVQLANDLAADFCYCDEFNRLAVIHASLSHAKLVTTPRLLQAFVLDGTLSLADARAVLDSITAARSWSKNAYVQQARSWFTE